jgi:hypothetical protein
VGELPPDVEDPGDVVEDPLVEACGASVGAAEDDEPDGALVGSVVEGEVELDDVVSSAASSVAEEPHAASTASARIVARVSRILNSTLRNISSGHLRL